VRWLVFAILAVCLTAGAAPLVEIKAQSRLALERVKLRPDGDIEVTGQLVDKLTSEGLDGTVQVRMGGRSQTAYAGSDGRFRAVFSGLVPGPQPVELRFSGSARVDKADALTVVVDPSRAQVTLVVRAEATKGGATLHITTTVEDTPASLPVQLAIGDAAADTLAPLQTVDSGKPFLLARAAAGGPGAKRIRATFAGDATRQQASAETTFELASETKTTLELADGSVAFEDDIVITGKVTDEDGQPVGRAQVALSSGDRRLAQAATNDDGGYKFEIEAEILGQGQQLPRDFGLQVQADPVLPFLRPSRSSPAIVTIAAPQPVPVSYTVVAFLATALAAGGFFTARAKPWRRFKKPAAPAETATDDHEADILEGGLVTSKPGLVSTLRRPHDDSFSGVVRDTVRGRPIADAIVRVIDPRAPGDREHEVRTGPDGGFAFERLPIGEWRVEVGAMGHVTERFGVSIPHRGELRGVRVDLVPVRERVFQLYRRAAEPSLPEARLWGIWSPRQIVDHVRQKRPSPALAELTDFVEEVYFSSRLSSESVLPATSERVDQALRERVLPERAQPERAGV
jgi:hypothetical protein